MAMRSLLRPLLHNAGLAAGLLSMLAACAGGNRFVLLEDEDGGVGAIVVENRGGSRTLSELHAATEVGSAGTAPSAPQRSIARRSRRPGATPWRRVRCRRAASCSTSCSTATSCPSSRARRSEEHTSELQSL